MSDLFRVTFLLSFVFITSTLAAFDKSALKWEYNIKTNEDLKTFLVSYNSAGVCRVSVELSKGRYQSPRIAYPGNTYKLSSFIRTLRKGNLSNKVVILEYDTFDALNQSIADLNTYNRPNLIIKIITVRTEHGEDPIVSTRELNYLLNHLVPKKTICVATTPQKTVNLKYSIRTIREMGWRAKWVRNFHFSDCVEIDAVRGFKEDDLHIIFGPVSCVIIRTFDNSPETAAKVNLLNMYKFKKAFGKHRILVDVSQGLRKFFDEYELGNFDQNRYSANAAMRRQFGGGVTLWLMFIVGCYQ